MMDAACCRHTWALPNLPKLAFVVGLKVILKSREAPLACKQHTGGA